MDLQESLNLCCRTCWDDANYRQYDEKTWRKECNKQRRARENNNKDHNENKVRALSFTQTTEEIGNRNRGEDKNEYWQRVMQATVELALAIKIAFDRIDIKSKPIDVIEQFQMKSEQITQKSRERLWKYERGAKKGFMAMTFETYKDEVVQKQEGLVNMWAYAQYFCVAK